MKQPLVLTFDQPRRVPGQYRPLVFRRVAGQRLVAFDYLRAFVIGLVVLHHASMAYRPEGQIATAGAYLQSSAPVVDHASSGIFDVAVTLTDGFFMPLMFLLSGLFVRASLKRKGLASYLVGRARRLGVPLVVGLLTVIPLAYYASYLQAGGSGDFFAFWAHMVFVGPWPSGPLWFLAVLLALDSATAILLTVAEQPAIRRRWFSPGHGFMMLMLLSIVAYVPLRALVGTSDWLSLGPLTVQTSRIGLYALYFGAGVAIGADRLAEALEHRWLRWPLLAAVTIPLYAAFHDVDRSGLVFVLYAAAMSAGLLALAVRLGRHRNATGDSLSANAYAIYLLHWPIVLWLQLVLTHVSLGGSFGAIVKGGLVLALGFGLSWYAAVKLRQVPAASRFL